jgi:hypothetical protein
MNRACSRSARPAALTLVAAVAALAAMAGTSQAASVAVTDLNNGATPESLAQSLAGAGVTVSNVKYTGNARAAGSFIGGTGSIGFENGVVLSSGKTQTYSTDEPCSGGVEGPNTCYEAAEGKAEGPSGVSNSTAFGSAGDTQLTELSGFETFDASVLEFEFVPQHSTLQVSYVFGSEEYSDFANTEFNDVFAFFVNGTNCALVPGTTEPVSVNTINNGNDQEGGDATSHHAEFFRDNVRPNPTIDTQMDGLTTVLTCNATVNVGVKNKMKLAIADASDEVLDSAVFLEAGSLISGTQVTTSLSGGGKSGGSIIVPEGTSVADSATLAGTNAKEATGTVEYKIFSDSECTKEVASAGSVTVAAGVVPSSEAKTLAPGTYYWQAHYTGDTNNNASTSTCGSEVESVEASVKQKPTELSTSLSGEGKSGASITVNEGASVSDGATLSGTNASKATGSVEYNVYSDSACTKLVTAAGKVTVSAGSVPGSEAKTLAPGTYYWQASYGGDSTNESSKSECGSEVETVEAAVNAKPTQLSTSLSGEGQSGSSITVKEGASVTDASTLSGENASSATGTVEYNVYSDAACTKLVASAGSVTVSGDVVPASEVKTLTPAGTYYWQASYSGDASNEGSKSACGSEVETVEAALSTPTVKTEPASSVAQTSATLNGLVNPNGNEVTRCEFEYGTTESYGGKAACTPAPGSGSSNVAVAAAIGGLSENTTYHFRVIAVNGGGESKGADEQFTTPSGGGSPQANSLTLAPKTASGPVDTSHTVTASVKDKAGNPVAGVSVVFSVAGANSAHGSATTDASGNASFSYSGTIQGTDTVSAFADNNGDGHQDPGEPGDTASMVWFGVLAKGSFVIGDGNAGLGTAVTFWGSQWSALNTLSGGAGPSSFKGFASTTSGSPPTCGGSWSTGPGNSSAAPAGPLPTYMPVIVSGQISQSGSTISGDVERVVLVRTEAGYAPDPGHAGHGSVVAEICSSASASSNSETRELLGREISAMGADARIGQLLKHGGVTFAFKAPEAGTAVIDWYQVPPGATVAKKVKGKSKAKLIAAGHLAFAAAGTAKIRLKLTAVGRRVLKHAKLVRLTAKATFTPRGEAPLVAKRSFLVRR